MTTPHSYRFTREQRLKRQGDFLRVLKEGVREARGPLLAHAAPSPAGVTRTRLGIRIGRRCGNAVLRNRVKRLLRESFRLMQHDWPLPIDLILSVKPHKPLALAEYQGLLSALMVKIVRRIPPTPDPALP